LTSQRLLRFLLPNRATEGISLIIASKATMVRILHDFLPLLYQVLLRLSHFIPLLLKFLPQKFVFLAQVLLLFIAYTLLLSQIKD
jgi:hypothetical protein